MPRIDPLQLLKCLSVLLSPEGGILSRDEVPRLVNLMTKFSKKLVSKCVYVLILKNTETSLVDMFMAEGGWTLIQTWLQDAAQSGNWVLVKEILGLLLITPVDVERLKMNCLPKLIKNLSRREDLDGVAELSNQIVQNWLVIVKGSAHNAASNPPSIQAQLEKRKPDLESGGVILNDIGEPKSQIIDETVVTAEIQEQINEENNSTEDDQAINTSAFYKSAKDNKEAIKKSSEGDKPTTDSNNVEEELKNGQIKDNKINEKDNKINEKDKDKSSKSSSSSRSKSSSSGNRDKDRDKDRKRSSHSSSNRSKSSSSRDKDKDRKDKDRDRRDKDRSKHRSSSKSSKSSSKDKNETKDKSKSNDSKDGKDFKENKEKQAERDKDTLQKLKPQTLDKLGRIPKKSSSAASDDKPKENKTDTKSKDDVEKDLTKKPSFSILNRKASGEERTKTVKVFNSKMRSTGLEEEVKPPPPRSAKKVTPSVQLPTIPPKRPSPTRELSSMPPEKKLKIDKIDLPERPGAIKLIPPKPKPPVLQESDMFMDALTASAPKKEAKKRKRRLSVTKDAPSSPSSSPANGDPLTPTSPTPTGQPTTALGLKNIAPINFYQDTLSEESGNSEENKNEDNAENKDSPDNNSSSPETNDTPTSPIPSNDAEPVENEVEPPPAKVLKADGLKGVLLYTKKKGPKRSITWKAEEDLVDIRYFELDETERVNVTKTFGDMAKMDISSEREALIMSRKPAHDDFMEPQTMWRMLYICDQPDHLAAPGSKSLEKDIQFAREKTVLPAIYFDKRRIPDNPEEPIPETHQMSDPVIIPLEDAECQEMDLRNTPWPEPKGPAPQVEPQPMAPIFPNMPINPIFNNMGNMPPGAPFVGGPPRFPGPAGPLGPMGPGPVPYGPPNMMHPNMMGPPINQQEIMNQGPINPAMYGPVPDGYMGPVNEPNFPMQQFNGPPGPNMNMYGPNNFNHRGDGDGGYRRGGNNGGWVRMNGPRNNWKRGRGGGARGGRKCKNILNHGYCRNGDNCPFVH